METNPFQESLGSSRSNRQIDARLRHLDVDDLYLLSFLGDGKRLADAARSLSLSQPAITQRIHKIEQALSVDILERTSRVTRLTEAGLHVCRRSSDAVSCLERFFEGRVQTLEAIAVTGAWAAWIIANALSKMPSVGQPIDVEFVSPEVLLASARNQEGFGSIVATLHYRSSKDRVQGYSAVSTVERTITLWHAANLVLSKVTKPIPLIEVARDEKLIDASMIQEIEKRTPHIRGVRYAGTVAGAIQLALKGQGVLVAPLAALDRETGLVAAEVDWKGSNAYFDLLVDERAPVVGVVADLIQALK